MGIKINGEKKLFRLETKNSSYAFTLNADKRVVNLYWGPKIEDELTYDMYLPGLSQKSSGDNATYHAIVNNAYEYAANEPFTYDEQSLDVDFKNGIKGAWLIFDSYKISETGNELVVTLKDEMKDFYVDLHYYVYEELDLITRHSVIRNETDGEVVLNKFQSATLHFPDGNEYRLTHFRGNWGSEYQREERMVDYGRFVIQNNHGNTSGPHAYPAFFIDRDGLSTETDGETYFGTLHWSGNFKITVEKTSLKRINVSAGINDEHTAIHLKKGEKFETPEFTIGFSKDGFAGISKNLYDLQLDYLMPQNKAHEIRPILYNAYLTYYNDIDEKKIMDLIPAAADLGVELFMIDDGWMPGRTGEDVGLGDWVPDKERFPRGLKVIADETHKHGMLFGLWVEPEMADPDSDLFREHEDWMLKTPGRDYTLSRNQVVLNIARDDICDWAMKMVDGLITDYDLDYVKWDMNRYISDFGFEGATDEEQDEIRVKYIRNIYKIWDYITSRHPDVLFENCAHGGARADYGMIKYTDRINRSDDGVATDVILIHEGFSRFFVPKIAGGAGNFNHGPKETFEFRRNMAFTGSCSLGFNLNTLTDEEFKQYKEAVVEFKKERADIQDSYVYRLKSAITSPYAIWEYVKRDGSVITLFGFVFGRHFMDNKIERIKLTGLVKGAKYRCVNDGKIYTQEGLENVGIDLSDLLPRHLASTRLRFEIVK